MFLAGCSCSVQSHCRLPRSKGEKGKKKRGFSGDRTRDLETVTRHLTPRLTSPHLTPTSPHLTSPHLTSPHLTSPHLTSPHLTSLPSYLDGHDALLRLLIPIVRLQGIKSNTTRIALKDCPSVFLLMPWG